MNIYNDKNFIVFQLPKEESVREENETMCTDFVNITTENLVNEHLC